MILEATARVGRVTEGAALEHLEEVVDVFFADGPTHTHLFGLVDRYGEGHLAVSHAQHEVVLLLARGRLAFLLFHDHGRAVMRVDNGSPTLKAMVLPGHHQHRRTFRMPKL